MGWDFLWVGLSAGLFTLRGTLKKWEFICIQRVMRWPSYIPAWCSLTMHAALQPGMIFTSLFPPIHQEKKVAGNLMRASHPRARTCWEGSTKETPFTQKGHGPSNFSRRSSSREMNPLYYIKLPKNQGALIKWKSPAQYIGGSLPSSPLSALQWFRGFLWKAAPLAMRFSLFNWN